MRWIRHVGAVRHNGRSRALALAAATLGVLSSAGCATIVSGTTQTVRFDSEPSGATVTVDGDPHTTPADVELSRKSNHEATFELDGYLSVTRQVLRSTNPIMFGNILIGGLIGLIVDYSSGASNNLEPDLVHVTLVPDDSVKEPDPVVIEPAGDADP